MQIPEIQDVDSMFVLLLFPSRIKNSININNGVRVSEEDGQLDLHDKRTILSSINHSILYLDLLETLDGPKFHSKPNLSHLKAPKIHLETLE